MNVRVVCWYAGYLDDLIGLHDARDHYRGLQFAPHRDINIKVFVKNKRNVFRTT